jgi:alkylhydroperoxidase family enzyme
MSRIEVPPDQDPLIYVWSTFAPPLTRAAGGFSDAVYRQSCLTTRELEAARITVARINDCALCLEWRSARDVPSRAVDAATIDEAFYRLVLDDPESEELSVRERLAAEFARRYCTEHRGMDDEFWGRLRAAYSDEELVDLGLCVASWLGLGRFNQVFGLDGACAIPELRRR